MKLDEMFEKLKEKNEKAFMAHVYCGDHDLAFSKKLIETLEENIDILELGIPFSDPLADGEVFRNACMRALDNGTKVKDVFDTVKELNKRGFKRPIVLTTYYNIIFKMGIEKFVSRLSEHKIQGLIVPDLPYEESYDLHEACIKEGIHLIYLMTPTTTDERIKEILKLASGFIYIVSVTGVTGTDKKAGSNIEKIVNKIREHSSLPLLLGFGISKPEQIKKIDYVDGFIVGSAICRLYQEKDTPIETLKEINLFTESLKEAMITKVFP